MAGGPCDLQIKTARIGVYIQNFPGKIQPLYQLGGHGGRLHLPYLHAAGGDDGLRHRPWPSDGHGEVLQQLHQRTALLSGHGVGLLLGVHPQTVQYHRHHAVGNQTGKDALHAAVGGLTQIPQDAALQLLFVQCRL